MIKEELEPSSEVSENQDSQNFAATNGALENSITLLEEKLNRNQEKTKNEM